MPEWLSTDNLAVVLLTIAVIALWRALQESQKREAAALREGIDMDRSYAAQLDSMAAVQSSMQRTQESATKATIVGLGQVEKAVQESADRVIRELQQ